MSPQIVTSSKVFSSATPSGGPATLFISPEGKITDIKPSKILFEDLGPDHIEGEYLDLGDKWILPGLVDCHVHLNEPGRTEWEGFATGTQAAGSGGVTTVIDMPLNAIPPTITVPNLKEKLAATAGKCHVDVGFWGGIIPGNELDIIPLVKAGVKGFKSFLIESGVEEFPAVCEKDILPAMALLSSVDSLYLFHAELEEQEVLSPLAGQIENDQVNTQSPRDYSTFLESRPPALEENAIELILRCASHHPSLRTHIVHLSAATAIPRLRRARQEGVRITVETCFHYLCLSAEQVAHGETLYKCCPPIREESNRELLWKALLEGDIDFVVSDHSPCTVELKRLENGDFMNAWGGIGGLGLGLSLMFTEATRRKIDAPMEKILKWVAEGPARQVGLIDRKGSLDVGKDADWVVFDPQLEFVVNKNELHFKNRASPYEGLVLTGAVLETYLRGVKIYNRERGFKDLPVTGQLLL